MQALHIAILSQSARLYSTRRIKEAAVQRGHHCKVLDTMKFGIYVEPKDPSLTFRGRGISTYDAIIPRIGSSISFYGASVVRQFEQMGVFSLNSSIGISIARDKLRSMQALSRHDIGVASTAFVRDKKDVLKAIERVGGAPVIIKLLEGTQGVGVILAEDTKVAEAIIETFQSTKQNVLVQKFVKESKGKDIRAFVIGDRVVAAMRRSATGTEFRSNVHRGGTTEAVEITPEIERTAVRAAQIIGLRVAGVDMLESDNGLVIMEVNASPGLEGIEKATGVDIAGAMIEYLEDHNQFGDPDIRQRLSFARGYVVAEFTIGEKDKLVDKTLAESGLGERGIMVMSINRQGQHLPAPTGHDCLQSGDILLCYGPKMAVKEFIPTLQKHGRRKSNKRQ